MRKRNSRISLPLDEHHGQDLALVHAQDKAKKAPRWWYTTPWHERKRARRIRDKQRMKQRARRVFEQVSASFPAGERQAFLRGCERLADNLAHCNKRCCNKARFWEGPNIQEIRARLAADQQDLGEEFERVLKDNLWELYLTD